jgi:cadmium resistance protein CadD (predicted permease)
MEWPLGALQVGVAAAIATTFDDNIYLTGFFSEVNRRFRPAHVVAGEVIGFSILMLISLVCFFAAARVPASVVGWLGALPILLGIRNAMQIWLGSEADFSSGEMLSLRVSEHAPGFASRHLSLADVLRDRETYSVSAVNISNGGNNLAIYIPLFASNKPADVAVIVLICYAAIGCWLFLSYRLTRLPGLSIVLSRYANRIFPFVLMWLGFRILLDSGALAQLVHPLA